jgi:hypothetical protein
MLTVELGSLAPKDRITATPETVSPKSEYKGDRVIESRRLISLDV